MPQLCFRTVAENLAEAVLVIDADGGIRYASPPVTRLTGRTPEELAGRSGFEFIHPEDVPRLGADLAVLVGGGELPGPSEVRLQRPDGAFVHIELLGRSLLDDPEVEGVVITLRDVSERVAMTRRLAETERMEAFAQLTGGIAHGFNNALTVIEGHAEMALQTLEGRAEVREDVEAIQRAARRAAALTEQLLTFARQKVFQPEVVDVSALLRNMEPRIREMGSPGVGFRMELEAAPRLWIDPGALRRVVVQLVENACAAMPGAGELALSLGRGGSDTVPTARLEVSDTGRGMEEGVRARVFEPFYRGTGGGEDAPGLGMAMVLGVVQEAGGTIELESSPGVGTRVRIEFPAWMGEAVGRAEPSSAGGSSFSGSSS